MLSRPAVSYFSRLAGAVTLALAATGPLACSSSPERYSPGPDRTLDQRRKDFPVDHAAYAKIGYRLDWMGFPSITGSQPIDFVQPYPDLVAALEHGSTVSLLEPNTGARRCADQLANPLTRFVGMVREGNRLFCAAEAEVFIIDTQTCNLAGRTRLFRNVSTQPVMYGDLLIFGSGAGEVFASLAAGGVGGVKVWGYLAGGPFEHKPVLIGNAVGAVSQSGSVVFLDAASGGLLGQTRVFGPLETDPVADDHLMYVASLDQSIYAFAPQGAVQVWRYRTPGALRVQPTVAGGRLYCAVPGKGLTAFEAATGNIVWSTSGFDGTVIGSSKGRLLAWDGHEAALIDPARGDVMDRAALKGVRMLKPDKFENGNLFVVSESGVVAKFLPQ
jgi:hypothetical protein